MAGISLQDLIHRFHLSQDLLDKEVSDKHVREASRIIDDHKILGSELGLTTSEMTAINENAKTHELQKEAMLTKWKQKFLWKATYRALLNALLSCSRANHARELCKLLAQSKCFWNRHALS